MWRRRPLARCVTDDGCNASNNTREVISGMDSHGVNRYIEVAMHHQCKKWDGHDGSHHCYWCRVAWEDNDE